MDALAAACKPGFSDDDDMAGFSVQDPLALPQLPDTSVGRSIYSIPLSSHVAPPAVSAFFQHVRRTPSVEFTFYHVLPIYVKLPTYVKCVLTFITVFIFISLHCFTAFICTAVAATPFVPAEKAIQNHRKRKLLLKQLRPAKRGAFFSL